MSSQTPEFGPQLYLDTVLDYSERLESMSHSVAFERVLEDNLITECNKLTLDEVDVPRWQVPDTLLDAHHMPSNFIIKNFDAELSFLPPTKPDEHNEWRFCANYSVKDIDFKLVATSQKTTISFLGYSSEEEMEFTLLPGMATTMLTAVAAGVLRKTGVSTPEDLPESDDDIPEAIKKLLSNIGNLDGKYTKTTVANLPVPEQDRSLYVRQVETETPKTSGLCIDFTMAWRFDGNRVTAALSHQEEQIGRENDSHIWSVRYAERRPDDQLAPEDLPFAIMMRGNTTPDHTTSIFVPSETNLSYQTVNTSLMAVLMQFLEKYEELDVTPATPRYNDDISPIDFL